MTTTTIHTAIAIDIGARSFILSGAPHTPEHYGFISGGPNRYEEFPRAAEVYALYLLKEHQGHGIGTKLLRVLSSKLRRDDGHADMIVWVLADNPYRGFYQRVDAKKIAKRRSSLMLGAVNEVAYAWDDLSLIS